MTPHKKPRATTRGAVQTGRARTTLPLKGTTARVQVALDPAAVLAIEYAQEWATRASGPKPPAAGIVRRALSLYVAHLSEPQQDHRQEAAEVARACRGHGLTLEGLESARQRVQGSPADAPLPPFLDVLLSPEARAAVDAMDTRVDALLSQIGRRTSRTTAGASPCTPTPRSVA